MRICGMECIWAPLAGEQMKIYIKRRSVSGEGCCPLIFHGFSAALDLGFTFWVEGTQENGT